MKKITVLLSVLLLALFADKVSASITVFINGQANGSTFVQGSFFQILISDITPGATTANQLWIDENGDGLIDPANDFMLVPFSTTDGVSGNNGPGDADGSVNGSINIQIGGIYFPVANYIFKVKYGTDSTTSTFSVTAMTNFTYTVSGKVSSPGILKNIAVSIETDTGNVTYIGLTDINGNYSIPTNFLSGTTIKVKINLGNNGDFNSSLSGYYAIPGKSSFIITKDTSGIDFVMFKGIIVTGTVTDINAKPIPNMQVSIEPYNTGGNSYIVNTDTIGVYMDVVPPGVYAVSFGNQGNPDPRGYIFTFYNQGYTYNTSNPITVTASMDTIKGINGILSQGGLITGTISDGGYAESGQSISVYHYNDSTRQPLYQINLPAFTSSYRMYVPPGTYTVLFNLYFQQGNNNLSMYYSQSNNPPGTPVTVNNINDIAKNINVDFSTATCTPIIFVNGNNNICSGSIASFTANYSNGGSSPMLQWIKNGIKVGSNTNFYEDSLLNNGDSISCLIYSNASCNTGPSTVNSNVIYITLNNDISGNIIHASTIYTIPEAIVTLNGNNNEITNGNYRFNCLTPYSSYTVKVKKNNEINKTNGVTALDIALVQSNILGKNILNSPYKLLAADVNGEGKVTALDIVYIKRLILGIDTTFTNTYNGKDRLWVFVDSTYTFSDNTNPFPHKDSITYTGLYSNKVNQTFLGCKLGDVNWDWNPGNAKPVNNTTNAIELSYSTDNIKTIDGYISIPVRVKDFKEMLGMQFTISFNSVVLQWLGLNNNSLGFETSTNQAAEGSISFLWIDPKNEIKTLEDGTVLFELIFRTIKPFSNETLDLNNSITTIAAYDKEENLHGIVLKSSVINSSNINKENWLVVPNPTVDGIIQMQINLKDNKTLVFRLIDNTGRLLLVKQVEGIKGINNIVLKEGNIPKGTYYLNAFGMEGIKVIKVVKAN